MIEVDAIIKNERGFAAKVYTFENLSIGNSNDHSEVNQFIKEDPECFMYSTNYTRFLLKSPDQTLYSDGFEVRVSTECRTYTLTIDRTFKIHSISSVYNYLSNQLTAKDCATFLNKIKRVGLIAFVKTYCENFENELKILQTMDTKDTGIQNRIIALATLVSSIKQWLFLND